MGGSQPGRLKAILLLVISLLFVAAGVFVLLFGPVMLGLVVIAFFGGCALIGLTQLLGADHPATPILMGVGSIGMGLGCLAMLAGGLSGGPSDAGDWVMVAIMLIGALFFGAGGVLLVLLPLLRRRRSVRPQVPSPVLPLAEVEARLEGRLAQLGGAGGGFGGGVGAGIPGAVGGRSGGAFGAQVGTRHLTHLDGAQAQLPVALDQQLVQHVLREVFGGRAEWGWAPDRPVVLMTGMAGSGAAGMNPCVLQVVWSQHGLEATAHAREGLIGQRTCAKTLEKLESALNQGTR